MAAGSGAKDSPENTHFSWEEMVACVEEGGRRRVPVMAHAHGAQGIALAAAAGCRSIEHASFIDDAGIDACLKHNTWIVPTFTIGEYYDSIGSVTGAQDRMIALQKATNERYFASIQKAVQRGVKVALGSDFVGWDPKITAREFRYLVELGSMTPLQAVLAGTSSAADLLGYGDLGRVCVGARADLVAVQGDPLQDISLLESGVVCVVKGGHVVMRRTAPCGVI
jgi:imidazolonepropionase-like amidohydrolase